MSLGLTIISIGIFNGLMLSIIFLRKKDHNLFLGLFILAHCAVLFKYFNNYLPTLEGLFLINTIGNLIEWTTAPLLYFYIKRFNNKPIPLLYQHFTPLLVMTIIHGLFIKQSAITDTLFVVIALMKVMQGVIYLYFSLLEIKNNSWLKMISILYITEVISITLYYIQFILLDQLVVTELFLAIVIILILHIIAFSGMTKSSLLATESSKKTDTKDQVMIEKTFKVIKDHIESSERYLSPSIKLSDLSKELGISEKLISQSINDSTGENINLFINRYRIKTAERLLLDDQYKNITIDAIAEMSGFSNKVSFYKAFKRIHNSSPKEFIDAQTTQK